MPGLSCAVTLELRAAAMEECCLTLLKNAAVVVGLAHCDAEEGASWVRDQLNQLPWPSAFELAKAVCRTHAGLALDVLLASVDADLSSCNVQQAFRRETYCEAEVPR